MKACEGMKL